ncbi:MAG: hypothetical protein V2A54_14780, partial [Bacteroidota bacterium]
MKSKASFSQKPEVNHSCAHLPFRMVFLCLLLSIMVFQTDAQNLVINPSFENVNAGSLQCSFYTSPAMFDAAINDWTNPTNGTSDILNTSLANTCWCDPFSTSSIRTGQHAPRTGNGMAGIYVYGSASCTDYREHLQGHLTSALVPGTTYCVEFYVVLAGRSNKGCNNLGVYFSTSDWDVATFCQSGMMPQLVNSTIISDTINWTLVSYTFTPTSAYAYFTIGNFSDNASTSTTVVGGGTLNTYYYVDDVSIQACSPVPVITVNNPTICAGGSATLTANSSVGGTTYLWNTGSTSNPYVVSPAATTTYTVTGTAGGNSGTATAVVTVNPLPAVTANSPTICAGGTATLTAGGASTYNWSTGSTSNPITVTPAVTTTYTVTGTSALGCTNTAQSIVTVNPLPAVTVNSPTICAGGTATLTANGASTYNWSTGSTSNPISVTPAVTTTYTVTGTSALGCTNTAQSIVTVSPLPIVTVNSPTICAGQTATLTANGASNYNWSTGSTSNPINVTPAVNTTYTVTGTILGCAGTATSVVTVNSLPLVTVNSDTICAGQTATLTANGGTTYLWNTGSTSNPITITPGSTTTYTV